MKPRATWAPFAGIPIDPTVVVARLEKLRVSNHGRLTPEIVVADARKKRSPIHDAFEWDDTKAAKLYRLERAGYLIRKVVVTIEEAPDQEPVRAFVHIEQGDDRYYTSVQTALSDPKLRAITLARALRDAIEWHKRYKQFDELSEIFQAIEKVHRRRKKKK